MQKYAPTARKDTSCDVYYLTRHRASANMYNKVGSGRLRIAAHSGIPRILPVINPTSSNQLATVLWHKVWSAFLAASYAPNRLIGRMKRMLWLSMLTVFLSDWEDEEGIVVVYADSVSLWLGGWIGHCGCLCWQCFSLIGRMKRTLWFSMLTVFLSDWRYIIIYYLPSQSLDMGMWDKKYEITYVSRPAQKHM